MILAVIWLSLLAWPLSAPAREASRWTVGYGQGILVYSVHSGADEFVISCSPDYGTAINVVAGGESPTAYSSVAIAVGRRRYRMAVDARGDLATRTPAAAATFRALWAALRAGRSVEVRLASGRATRLTLAGAAKALPRMPCDTNEGR